MSFSTSISDVPKPDADRLWAEAAGIAASAGDWPRQLRAGIAHLGEHPRRQAGTGADFWQYRVLNPGEPVAQIDWRKSARTDSLLVRDQEREVPTRLHLWCDQSPSMHYRSSPDVRTKADWAFLLAASLAHAAAASGEHVAALGAGAGRGLSRLRGQLPLMLALPPVSAQPASSLIVMVSDWLDGPDWLAGAVPLVLQARSRLVVVQVHDPAEAAFPFEGRLRFEGLEGEQPLVVDDAAISRATYLDAWKNLQNSLKKTVETSENMFITESTTTSVRDVLSRILGKLGRG